MPQAVACAWQGVSTVACLAPPLWSMRCTRQKTIYTVCSLRRNARNSFCSCNGAIFLRRARHVVCAARPQAVARLLRLWCASCPCCEAFLIHAIIESRCCNAAGVRGVSAPANNLYACGVPCGSVTECSVNAARTTFYAQQGSCSPCYCACGVLCVPVAVHTLFL